MNRTRSRSVALTALAVAAAVVVPAALAIGSHGGDPVTAGSPSFVQLSMSNGPQDEVTWTDSTAAQTIATRQNDCTVATFDDDPEYLTLGAFNGVVGVVKDGFGVKSSGDGAGEPCGRVEAEDSEAISVSLGDTLSGHLMTAVDVDLELKFNASVTVTYRHEGTVVHTNVFNPSAGSDDGPDSGDGDNYRYAFRPLDTNEDQVYFDEVRFTPTTGSLSLEGGADGTEDGALTSGNGSQFEVIATFDGEITCGDDRNIEEAGANTSGVVTMHAMDFGEVDGDWDLEGCLLKPYNDDVTDTALIFVPELEGTHARYTIEVTVLDQAITVDSEGQITSLIAEYNPEGDITFPDTTTRPLQACEGQPNLDPSDGGYVAFWQQSDTGLLPEGEQACFYSVRVEPTAADVGTEFWGIYFEDDPGLSWR